jgi:hypothetical protein
MDDSKIVEQPCPHIINRDTLDTINSVSSRLNGLNGFDIITFDDVLLSDFIKESSWHIIVKSNEKYYAFHRKVLYDYMKNKETKIESNCKVYDTPFNQSVSWEALEMFMYSDHTIYELIFRKAVPTKYKSDVKKSVYTVRCYSVSDWNNNMPNLTLTPSIPKQGIYTYISGAYEIVQILMGNIPYNNAYEYEL